MLFSGRFRLIRPKRIADSSRMGSLPTNSGGGAPAPGENGFLIRSMHFIPVYTYLYLKLRINGYRIQKAFDELIEQAQEIDLRF
jgi:hypothetical protein